jgi:hypothetical protein
MRTSGEIDKIAPAFVAAVAEIQPPKRSRPGTADDGTEYFYADITDDLDAARPVLAKYELAIIQEVVTQPTKVIVTTRAQHASGQFMETEPLELERAGVTARETGGLISYGRRYQLEPFLSMSAQHDDDAAAANRAQRATTCPPQAGQPARPAPTVSPQTASPRGSSPAPCVSKPPRKVSRPSLARLKRAIAAVGMSPAELTALFKKHKVADLAELGQDVASRLIDALEADAAVIAARVAEEGSAS